MGQRTKVSGISLGPEWGSSYYNDMNRSQLGMFGEDIAARFLKKRGYRILERNYRCRMGEIDIIAMKGGVLFFVEVKTRRDTHRGHPLESITLRKQRQVIKISEFFLMSYKREVSCRYAVIGVLLDQNGDSRIDFLPDAFTT